MEKFYSVDMMRFVDLFQVSSRVRLTNHIIFELNKGASLIVFKAYALLLSWSLDIWMNSGARGIF